MKKSSIPTNRRKQAAAVIPDKTSRPSADPAPSAGRSTFPIVGIGASAGGLAAFGSFFSGMPADADPGMAFVLVQHLAPDHKSILTDLIRRYTRMQVFEVEDGMVVQPNCAYIIPPNCDMALLNGALQLLEPAAPRGQRLPIDFFFRSLAHDQRERSICIVLSGTGSDGTLGARAVKGEGGMVMAQKLESTEFDGMPRSVIAAGIADYELPPAEMPARLIAYAARAGHLPPTTALAPQNESLLKKIFVLLRAQTGHDFSDYKPSTITRRIERRMAVQQIETMAGYVTYLQSAPAEVEALFRDMLIGVTNFFRDPDAFKELEEIALPRLFAAKRAGGVLRVWAPGCSTGEEAYSLAILIVERLEALENNIVKMAREGLRHPLALALHNAVDTKAPVRMPGVRVKANGHFIAVNLAVRPVPAPSGAAEAPLYLVVLEEAPPTPEPAQQAAGADAAAKPDTDARIAALQAELRIKEECLQNATEQQETSNEELKSSNEEMQSVNEELQSTNEELETAKEEMQSVNEELSTVNNELQTKVLDLSRANSDMNNLLAGTGIATVFLDHQLRVLRYTPSAAKLINLIPGDVGRPMDHIVSNLAHYTTLTEDAQAVLDTLAAKEVEVSSKDGRWYTLRLQPYRTIYNVIEGAVLTFIDITEMKRTAEALHKANDLLRLAVVVRDAHDAITVQDTEGRTLAWNPGAVQLYGWSEAEALAMNVRDRIPQAPRQGALDTIKRLSLAEILEPYRTQRLTKDGRVLEVSLISTALVNETGQMYAIATTERACVSDKSDNPAAGKRT